MKNDFDNLKHDELTSCREIRPNVFVRKTNEVSIKVIIEMKPTGGSVITLSGHGDCEHHLVEDTAILLNKIAEEKGYK
jgi:imidazoleglycerol phosphate dehydratase HisB